MIIGDGIMLGAGGESASIFVTGVSETDSVSATHKVPVKIPNPEWKSLPDGYTQLEYIESTGTQYIDFKFPITTKTFKIQLGALFSGTSSNEQPLISTWTSTYKYWNLFLNSNEQLSFYYASHLKSAIISVGTMYDIEFGTDETGAYGYSGKRWLTVGGATVSATTSLLSTNPTTLKLFTQGDLDGKTSGKVSYVKYYEGASLVHDIVAAKRLSDGAIGMYDLVTNEFFTNAGTGTFTAGAKVPQTIDGYVDGKTIIGKWTQIPNPAIVVPNGYTQLEYLQSTGMQYIVTGLNSKTRYDHEITFSDYTYAVKAGILGSSNYYYSYTGYNNTLRWCMSDRAYDTPGSLTSKRTAKLGYNYLTVDGSSVSSVSDTNSAPSDITHTLFKGNNCASVKIYSYRASLDGQLLRDFVPCKRNSDDELGMYDLVNDVFYANAGTGTFTAGAEIPPTINVFLIDKIKDYGTWTVTATDGTNTATQDVLVDAAEVFTVEVTL